jgi:cholesterol transport system auxiliary component
VSLPGTSRLAALLLSLLVAGGCGGVLTKAPPQKQRFKLAAQREGAPEQACDCTVRIFRIRVARAFERKRFVYQVGPDRFEEDFYNEFYAPPGELVRQATGSWLSDSGLFASVIGATDGAAADWLLQGRVGKLYADTREEPPRTVLEIDYTLLDARKRQPDPSFRKTYGHTTRAASRSAEAIVEAWQVSLDAVLASLEADLRVFFAEQPVKR